MRLLYGEFESYENYQYQKHIVNADSEGITMAFNYSGMREDIMQLGMLPVLDPQQVNVQDEEFDIQYMNWIFNDNNIFCKLMFMLENLCKGIDVFIIVADDSWTNILAESFFKILQKRYGLTAYHIDSLEDMQYINETDFDPYYGIRNFNADMVRYNDIKEANRIANGGRPYYE